MTALRDIVFSTDRHWVKRVPSGFEVYRNELTHAVRVAQIGWTGEKGLQRAKQEIARRETAIETERLRELATKKTPAQVGHEITKALAKARGSHAIKKSPAQLEREIAEALARAEAFKAAKAEEALVEKEMSDAQAALDVFPRGPMGLTPDVVKALPEYQAAKARADRAFVKLRAFNAVFVKRFAKELRAERAERTRARERA